MEHHTRTKTAAKELAEEMRDKGYACSVYKRKKGYGVSVRRK